MRTQQSSSLLLVGASAVVLLLSGCGMEQATSASLSMQGHVIGGQQPVSGASVQMYAVGGTGYSSAATALLSSPAVTDVNGVFTLPTLTCPAASTPVYVVATGGNPGLGTGVTNPNLALMTALGPCGNVTDSTYFVVNELTTVAAVWSVQQFMTGYDHVGTSATNSVGLTNAMVMADELVNTSTGTVPGVAPTGTTLPTTELNTLANVLASCVNSAGGVAGDGSACGKLFANASTATNTVTAALNIAKAPTANVSSLFGLASATGPFQPVLVAAPADWTLTLLYPGASYHSWGLMDANGNHWWLEGAGYANVRGVTPAGLPLTAAALPGGGTGAGILIDSAGNLWVSVGNSNAYPTLAMAPSDGSSWTSIPVTSWPAINLTVGPFTADGNGNLWITCAQTYGSVCNFVRKLNASGQTTSQISTSSVASSLLIDPSENVWIGSTSSTSLVQWDNGLTTSQSYGCGCTYPGMEFDNTGKLLLLYSVQSVVKGVVQSTSYLGQMTPPSYALTSATSPGYVNLMLDGANTTWATRAGTLAAISSAGAVLNSSAGYQSSLMSGANTVGIDPSGNVWMQVTVGPTESGSDVVSAVVTVGVAAPTANPMAVALKNGKLGVRP